MDSIDCLKIMIIWFDSILIYSMTDVNNLTFALKTLAASSTAANPTAPAAAVTNTVSLQKLTEDTR